MLDEGDEEQVHALLLSRYHGGVVEAWVQRTKLLIAEALWRVDVLQVV